MTPAEALAAALNTVRDHQGRLVPYAELRPEWQERSREASRRIIAALAAAGFAITEKPSEREAAYLLDATLEETVLAGTLRLDARGRAAVTALLEGTGFAIVPADTGEAVALLRDLVEHCTEPSNARYEARSFVMRYDALARLPEEGPS